MPAPRGAMRRIPFEFKNEERRGIHHQKEKEIKG